MARKAQPVALPEDIDVTSLSEQQLRIYKLAREHQTVNDIAAELGVAPGTVKRYISRIRSKVKNSDVGRVAPRVKSAPKPESLGLNEDEMAHLTGQQSKVVYLTQRGASVKDAAKVLGISVGTAKGYLHRQRYGKSAPASAVKKGYIKDLPAEEREKIMAVGPEKIDPGTAAFAFQTLVEGDRLNRKDLCALAREHMGGWQAKKALIGAHAQAFKVLAVGSRTPLIKVSSPAVKKMMSDVLANHFVQMTDNIWRPRTGNAHNIFNAEFQLRSQQLLAGAKAEDREDGHYDLIIPDEDKKGIAVRPMPEGLPALTAGITVSGAPAGKQARVGEVARVFEGQEIVMRVAREKVKAKRTLFTWGKGKTKEVYECDGTCFVRGGDEVGVSEDGTTLTIRKWVEGKPELKIVKLTDFEPDVIADMAARLLVGKECTIWYRGKLYHCLQT